MPGRNFVTAEQEYLRDLVDLGWKPESRLRPIPIPAQRTHRGVHYAMVEIGPVFARRTANSGFFAFAALALEPNTPAGAYLILPAGALSRATIVIWPLTGIEKERHFFNAQLAMTGNEWKQVAAELQIELPGSLVAVLFVAVLIVAVVRYDLAPDLAHAQDNMVFRSVICSQSPPASMPTSVQTWS
jgi:hypothetical protein